MSFLIRRFFYEKVASCINLICKNKTPRQFVCIGVLFINPKKPNLDFFEVLYKIMDHF